MKNFTHSPLIYSRDNAQFLRLEPFPHYLTPYLYMPLFESLVDLRLKAIEADWRVIFELGYRCQGLAHSTLRLFRDQIDTTSRKLMIQQLGLEFLEATFRDSLFPEEQEQVIADLLERAETIDPLAKARDAIERLQQDPVFTAISTEDATGIIEEVQQRYREVFDSIKSDVQIASAHPNSFSFLELATNNSNRSDTGFAAGGGMIIVGLSRGLVAVVHAAFNLTRRDESMIESLLSNDHLEVAKQRVDLFGRQLKQLQLDLFSACIRGDSSGLHRATLFVVDTIEGTLPAFMRFQAVLRQATERLLAIGRNGDAELLGYQNMLAGSLTREALGSHVAALRLQIEIGSGAVSTAVSELLESSRQLGFDGAVPDGRNTEIKDLPATQDGTFVEVKGFANKIEVFQEGDKPRISRVELLDPSNGTVFSAVIPFSHFPHMGLTPGAYCRLNGNLRSSSPLNRDAPAIEIDRVSLSSLARQSWRFAFIRIAEPWYEVLRSKLNMAWSIGPHHPPDDEQQVAEGAADLIYPPFIRD